jgi:uncharacterized protein YecE (DUF72 family)
MHNFFLGTSGYTYRDWKGRFYPESLAQKKWLSYYAQHSNSVEINGSFYTAIKRSTYEKWYEQTPARFQFALKGHRFITQMKKLKDVDDAVERFFKAVEGLEEKLAVVLWQFPASFKLTDKYYQEYLARLEHFLSLLPSDIRQAFEFRDSSWFGKDVLALLEKYQVAIVYSDSPSFPKKEVFTTDFMYLRFHGPGALYASSYSDKQLEQIASGIQQYLTVVDVYSYFNNDINGHAIANAQHLQQSMEGGAVYGTVR